MIKTRLKNWRKRLYYHLLERIAKYTASCKYMDEEYKKSLTIPDKSILFKKFVKSEEEFIENLLEDVIEEIGEKRKIIFRSDLVFKDDAKSVLAVDETITILKKELKKLLGLKNEKTT